MARIPRPSLDGLGTLVGLLCAVHCLVLPLVVGLVPLFGLVLLDNPAVEVGLVLVAVVVGALAAVLGRRHHRREGPGLLLLLGVTLLGLRLVLGESAMPGGHWFTIMASVLVVVGHLWGVQVRTTCMRAGGAGFVEPADAR